MESKKIVIFKIIFLPFIKMIAPLFFDKKYLRGRHFEKNYCGWLWVIRSIFWQKLLGFNRNIPWPVSPFIEISNPLNIEFDVDNLDNFQQFGNYFQNFSGRIIIGKGTYIAKNVGIITVNHNPIDLDNYLLPKDVIIGEKCWIGINSVILPGVILGNRTIVGAGSVVTKSFPEGNIFIGGNPAKILKKIDDK